MTQARVSSSPTAQSSRSAWAEGKLVRRGALLGVFIALALCVGLLWFLRAASAPSEESRAGQTAASYSQQQMVWTSGPTVSSVHILALRHLRPALAASVPSQLRQDVNLGDLERRYGANRQVALVVLSGVYNSLPPDEGVNINGKVVVLVDVRTNRVLLVTN